jgi:Protein of unknown function (DUF4232)
VPAAARSPPLSDKLGRLARMTRNTPRSAAPRLLMILAPTLVGAAVVAGLAGPTAAAGAPEVTAVPAAGAPAVAAVPAAGAPAVAAVSGCLTDDLTGTVYGRPRRAHSSVREAVLRLTNTSGRACRVRGWADIAMVTPPGELVRVPTRKVGQAGGGAEIVLKPQASAWSRLQWDTCRPGRPGCGVGVALQYVVDPHSTGTVADLSAVPEAYRAGITMKALRVSPLQGTRAAALS